MAYQLMTKAQAQRVVERHGLLGNMHHLLDVLPLIEVAWADGVVRPSQRAMILAFLDQHLKALDAEAGQVVVPRAEALRSVDRFLRERPSDEEFRLLREALVALRLDGPGGLEQAERILEGAIAVGSSTRSARGWDPREVEKLWELEVELRRD